MKAKEYFTRFQTENQDKPDVWRVADTLRQMVTEVSEVAKVRNTKSDSALRAIFNEQNQKANAFLRMVNKSDVFINQKLLPDILKRYVNCLMPDVAKEVWPDYNPDEP